MLSHTSSPPASTLVDDVDGPALRMWAHLVGAGASTVTVSPTRTGRWPVIELARWTVPIAGNGKLGSVMIAMCSGKASTCR